MPLINSKSDNARSKNIAELIKAGHKPSQAEAIAYKEQRQAKSKDIELKTPKAFSKAGFKSKFKHEWKTGDSESARKHDLNDFMEIKGNNISKIGVFPYSGAQIGSPELEPDKIYMVYRPEASLSEPETLESFKLIPFTDEHAMLGSEDGMMPAEEKGVHGVVGEDVYYEKPYLKANIKIFSEQLKNLINEGKKELSIGYRCAYEYNPGIYGDQSYDFIQREIRGNHLALVDEGRSGADVSVLDKLQFTYDTISLVNPKNLSESKKMPAKDEMMEQEDEGMSLEECAKLVRELAMKVDKMMGAEKAEAEEMEDENPELTEKAAAQGDEGDPDSFVKRADIEDDDEDPSEMEAHEKEKNAMKREQGEDEDEEKKEGDYSKPDGDTRKKGGAMDTKSLLREISQRDSLANRLSQHIGTFDHKEKTLSEVAKYGLKKLGIRCKPGHEESVLSGYLAGARTSKITIAQDSAHKAEGIEAYLKGVK